MKEEIARKIQLLRKDASMTQAELSEGICTQAQISNIEKGNLNPSSITLFHIAKKLNVDMNYFFDITYNKHEHKVLEIKAMIRSLVKKRDYETIRYVINNEKERSFFQTGRNKQFLLWHEAICYYHLDQNFEMAMITLQTALNLVEQEASEYDLRDIEIMNSMAIFYSESGQLQEAYEKYKQMLMLLEKASKHPEVYLIEARVLFGLARCTYRMGLHKETLAYSTKGEELCIKNESLYVLGELLFEKGRCLMELGKTETGLTYLNKARTVFEIERKTSFVEITEDTIDEYEQPSIQKHNR